MDPTWSQTRMTSLTGGDGKERHRVFGLDLMRAIAIVLVVFWHSADVLDAAMPGIALPPYVDGVDLFFVLSGFLI
ncbi:MAG: hypothetical protein IPJ85_15815 [Flavobacteriales bacterium]|nr:hypothetical protein [Flavobacteriales bacterium]